MLCPFWLFLIFLSTLFGYLIFCPQLFLKFVRRCFGRLDGSIRALRKVRIRNETDNFIESISQMVPRWSPEVPKTDNFLPRGVFYDPELAQLVTPPISQLSRLRAKHQGIRWGGVRMGALVMASIGRYLKQLRAMKAEPKTSGRSVERSTTVVKMTFVRRATALGLGLGLG